MTISNASELGFDRSKIFLSGSSAGAHLASMVVLTVWESFGLPPDVIKGVTLMSGIYDLRPICRTYVNEPLGMDEAEAYTLSPLFCDLSNKPPAIICWGENETDEFKRQSQTFFRAWRDAGNEAVTLKVAGRNHSDLVHTLADSKTALGQQVFAQMSNEE